MIGWYSHMQAERYKKCGQPLSVYEHNGELYVVTEVTQTDTSP